MLQGAINAALEALGRGLALERAPIRVNTMSPGLIDTPLWGGMGKAEREAMFARTTERLPARRVGQPGGRRAGDPLRRDQPLRHRKHHCSRRRRHHRLRRAPLDLKPGYRPDFLATTTERPTLKGLNIVRHLLATATIIGALFSTPVDAAEVRIDDPVIGKTVSTAQNEATMKATKAFYRFWNTGDETVLKAAIAPTFTDHTLPPGRPQGPEGPSFASKNFRHRGSRSRRRGEKADRRRRLT